MKNSNNNNNGNKLETLIHAVRICSRDIGMEFGTLVMKSGKRHQTDKMKLPNQDKIRTLGEKGTYKLLEHLRG